MHFLIRLISLWFVLQLFQYQFLGHGMVWRCIEHFNPHRILFLVIIGVFSIQMLRNRIKLLPLSKIEVCMITFAAICTISLINSGLVGTSQDEYGNVKYGVLNTLFNLVYFPFVTYFIIRRVGYKVENTKFLLAVFCLIGFYLCLTGILEHFKLNGLVWPKYIMDYSIGTHPGRTRGPFVNAVTMGRMLTVSFLCIVLMANEHENITKFIMYVFAMLTGVAIYFTYTRGPWVGFALSLLVLIASGTKMKKQALIIVLVGLLMFGFSVGSKFSASDGTIFSKRQTTVDGRLINWAAAFNMARANPFFGVGYGRYNTEFWRYYSEIEGRTLQGFDGNHNTILGILAELGFIGMSLYVTILCLVVRMCLKLYRKLDGTKPFEKGFITVTIAIWTMYVFTCFFSDSRWQPMENSVAFLFFGIASSLDTKITKPENDVKTPEALPA